MGRAVVLMVAGWIGYGLMGCAGGDGPQAPPGLDPEPEPVAEVEPEPAPEPELPEPIPEPEPEPEPEPAPEPEPEPAPEPEPEPVPEPEPMPEPEPIPDPQPEPDPPVDPDPLPPVDGGLLYPSDLRHSPIGPEVAAHLRSVVVAGGNAPRIFAKIGDSLSLSPGYLGCFVSDVADLGENGHLEDTHAFFLEGRIEGTTPYDRHSEAVRAGWTTVDILRGDPSVFEVELARTAPSHAFVLLGTNDVPWIPEERFAENLLHIVDRLLDVGAVPLLATLPPRADDPAHETTTRRFNAIVRAVAQARHVPLADVHAALLPLPSSGLRDDGVHLTYDWNRGGQDSGCRLTAEGLAFGGAMRNLLSLEQIDRARRALASPGGVDAGAPRLPGGGTAVDPFHVQALPFGHLAPAPGAPAGTSICGLEPNGDPAVYRVDHSGGRLELMVLGLDGLDTELAVRTAAGECVAVAVRRVALHLSAGTDEVVVVGRGGGGAYLFTATAD